MARLIWTKETFDWGELHRARSREGFDYVIRQGFGRTALPTVTLEGIEPRINEYIGQFATITHAQEWAQAHEEGMHDEDH